MSSPSRYQVPWAVYNKTQNTGPFNPSDDGSTITFRANHPTDAEINFNNTDNSVTNAFNPEDEVQIFINGILMFDGIVYTIQDVLYPSRQKDLNLSVMDWGSYVIAKTIFEKDYEITKYCKDLLLDGANKVQALYGGYPSISGVDQTGLSQYDFAVKGRRFQGTYVKDVWYAAAETGGFDYYIDETKTLQAWPFDQVDPDGSGNIRQIQIGGHNYQVVDFELTEPYQLMIHVEEDQQSWIQDTQNTYHFVQAENGLINTYPAIIDNGSTDSVQPKAYAYELSMWWGLPQSSQFYDQGTGSIPTQKPFDFISSENVATSASRGVWSALNSYAISDTVTYTLNGITNTYQCLLAVGPVDSPPSSDTVHWTLLSYLIPTIHIFVGSNSQNFTPSFSGQQYVANQTGLTNSNMQQPYGQYQKIGFYINLSNLTGTTMTNIVMQLVDLSTSPGGSWQRSIYGDFVDVNGNTHTPQTAGWIYLEYYTPTSNTSTSNGWTVTSGINGPPQNIDLVQFFFTPGSGYTVGSHADFGQMNLWGIMSEISSKAPGLPTQQIIVNRNITDPTQLQNYATRSFARSSVTKQGPQVTIDGFDMTGNFRLTDFKRPGYHIDIDLSSTMGITRKATSLRIDEIVHKLSKGFTLCTLTFDNSFYRP